MFCFHKPKEGLLVFYLTVTLCYKHCEDTGVTVEQKLNERPVYLLTVLLDYSEDEITHVNAGGGGVIFSLLIKL